MSIAEFSVKNSILAWMLTIVVVVGGLIAALVTLKREVFPVTEINLVVIRTIYPNASPQEVEDQITNVIEDEINGINGIEEYRSSSSEGVSVVVVEIDPEADNMFRVINAIQRRVDQIDDLPDEAEDPVTEAITTDQPVINVCVAGTVPERELRAYGDNLERRLRRIPGVSSVDKQGWREEEFWVEADPKLLHAYEISLIQLIESLRASNVTLPGGKLNRGDTEIILRTVGKFHTVDEIKEVVMRSNLDGQAVTVGDVAQVRRMFEEDAPYSKANGQPTLILGVKKKNSSDAIEIADAVKALVEAEREVSPDGIQLLLVDDTSYYIKRRLRVLTSNGGIGMVLVLICLFIALNHRVALFTALGIPFSFLGTLMLMSYFGMTINLMTMFGLIIVLGMIVDDTIIVGENIARHLEMGKTPAQAAIDGANEVTAPVVATVLTTVAAFFPLLFAPDLYATYLGWLVLAVIICLFTSLLECLFIMPSHIADFARPIRQQTDRLKTPNPDQADSPVKRAYLALLRGAIRWRYGFLLAVVVIVAAVGLVIKPFVRIDLFPGDMVDIVFIHMAAAEGTTIEKMEGLVGGVENVVREMPDGEVTDYVTYMAQQLDFEAGMNRTRGAHFAQIIVYLKPQDKRERKMQDIISDLRKRAETIEGFERLSFEMVKPGPPVGKPLEVHLQGRDFTVLQTIADEVKDYLGRQAGVSDIEDDFGEGKDERHLIVDERKAAQVGLRVDTVAQTVFIAYQGAKATTVREGKDELAVRVMLKKPYRDDDAWVTKLRVPNAAGRLISLGEVSVLKSARGLPTINHFDGERVVTVGAEIDTGLTTSAAVNAELDEHFANLSARHPGYSLSHGGEYQETQKVVTFMKSALVVAILLIYTILGVQFRSFMQPFVLLVPIPLCFVVVVAVLLLHGKDISIMAMLGMVGLGGVVVNDAIILVTFINNERRAGTPLGEAITSASSTRVRPILLTSITTVLGLLPVIYGIGGYEPFIAPAAIVLAFGLLFATFLTLVIVPVIYYIGADVKQFVTGRNNHA